MVCGEFAKRVTRKRQKEPNTRHRQEPIPWRSQGAGAAAPFHEGGFDDVGGAQFPPQVLRHLNSSAGKGPPVFRRPAEQVKDSKSVRR